MTSNILIGITSSIASYKIYELIRLFKKNGYNVKTVLSQNALQFVSSFVLETLSGERCYYNQFAARDNTEHIALCDWADIFIVAPLSANTLSKMAHGIADNLLTSVFCAYLGKSADQSLDTDTGAGLAQGLNSDTIEDFRKHKKQILLAPAMNTGMYNNPLVQKNLKVLGEFCEIIPPETGFLACGAEGVGRLCDIDLIYHNALRLLHQDKKNNSKKVVVTLGGTREMIDNVRCITNLSSGKMGTALCDFAYYKGFDVTAVSTVALKRPYKTVDVESADEMLKALKELDFDYLIMAAAVCDYRVQNPSNKKIAKEDMEYLKFIQNPDIVKTIAASKKTGCTIAGFCLGDENLIEKAKEKLKNKNLDYIIANDASALNSDKNRVTIISKNDRIENIDFDTKKNIAKKILEVICD